MGEVKLVSVRAKAPGFDSRRSTRVKPGEVFLAPEGVSADWYEPVAADAVSEKLAASEPQKPVALSQIARGRKRIEKPAETLSEHNAQQLAAPSADPAADLV